MPPASARVAEVAEQVGGASARVAESPAQVGGASARVAEVAEQVGGASARVAESPAQVGGASARVAGVPVQVGEASVQVAESPTQVGEASGQVPEATAQLTQGDTSALPGAPSGRPQPLHEPDPYGTPPYGQPGPWAPAPPVQHPAATPAQGTHVPAGASALGTPVDAVAPAAPGIQLPLAAHGTELPPAAPGTRLPLGTPVDAVPPAAPGTQLPPAAHGTQLPSAAHGTQLPPARNGGPAPSAPAPSAPAPGASPAPYTGIPHGTAPAPWQNYDPWAAPGPLQQNGAAVATVRQRRKRAKKVLVLGAVVLALVSGGVGGAVGAYLERNGGMGDVELPQAAKEAPGRAPDSVAGIAAHALPSVVTLHVRGSEEEGTGTGFVLDSQGHILTNNHVIEPAGSGGEISVTFSGGETAKAEVVGHDSGYDLAVVKVSGVSGLDPIPLGNSDNVQVGDPVVAIGAPFDLANTVTSGIISAKERPITAGGEKGDGSDVSYVDALQTDAPINPGNSGGPLLDSKARVIGINSAIRSADSGSDLESGQAGSIGLGFAIPINQGKRVAEELINTGKATHPVIGVTLDMDYSGDGARVGTKGNGGGPPVTAGGPGAEAGIKAGDVITEVDGQRVHSGEELIVKTRAHRPGDRLQLTLRRGGTEKKVTLVLGSADGQ
ncbi:trypsin-like peptidase domain-containing protein [Streptomyces sp. NPDC001530]|uniref:S1C family serine protease n=1 Tax=Streptomyces sp. NPDC001530 TaxID=3364582 RepID=UPI0036CFA3E4